MHEPPQILGPAIRPREVISLHGIATDLKVMSADRVGIVPVDNPASDELQTELTGSLGAARL